ncbi:MAG: ABC transporter ATP-binding protein [Spirochaetota bacterium]|nr:ABC transporter ATP-binding protein [Spirochaetota bacterium]
MESRIFIRILKFLLPYKGFFLLGTLFAFLFSIANCISLSILVPIFDTLSPGENVYQIQLSKHEKEFLSKEAPVTFNDKFVFYRAQIKVKLNSIVHNVDKFTFLIYICIGLLAIIIMRMLFKLLSVYYVGFSANGAIRDIRQLMYQSILNLPVTYFHRQKTGGLISKIIYDIDLISGILSNQLRKFIVNIFIMITHIALLLYINLELTLMAFVVLIIITIPILSMGRMFKRYSRIEQEKMAEISSMTLETIEGIRIIKTYQMENFQINRFLKSLKILLVKKIKKAMIDISRPQIIEIISSLFLVFLFIFGGRMILSGEYTKGEFMFYVFTFLYLMNPIKQIANMNNQVKQAESAGERAFELVDHEKEVENNCYKNFNIISCDVDSRLHEHKELIAPKTNIRFENISFKYPFNDEYVLKDINFTIGAGKSLAIVGRSGAGKTTLVDLLPRFLEVTEGAIYIDDVDIKTIPLTRLRRSIGVVSQEIFLFNGTVSENIAYGKGDVSFESIVQAARIANADEFIIRMPDGYNTEVGDRGIMVSGGERQRISIARSILRNPPILILDEATSSLDAESEGLVQGALFNLMSSRTSFVIAHRLSTIKNSDLIIVIDSNSIVEMGTHDELISIDGLYRALYRNAH